MVTLIAYADPNTDWCHREVRIPSIMVVGPKAEAMAYMPNAAPVPALDEAKFTNVMHRSIPAPQIHTGL